MRRKLEFFSLLTILSVSILGLSFDGASTDLSTSFNFPVTMPVVFVDPLSVAARLGENVTVGVRIFNLTDAYYVTDQPWIPGDEVLGPPGTLHNYSLGNLFGFEITFRWNPDTLAYVNHTVKVPVELFPDGVLHEPNLTIVDDVDENAGIYQLAATSLGPETAQFNSPDANATVFTMTFEAIKRGVCNLSLDSVDLATKWDISSPHENRIPNVIRNGWFETSSLETWIESLEVGFSKDEELLEPIILGENASVRVVVRNDNLTMAETYNLTLYHDGAPLEGGVWTNRILNPGEAETLNCTIPAYDLGRGIHLVNASVAVLHGSEALTDELTKQFRVVDTPILHVEAPIIALPGETVTFNASQSSHNDPDGTIQAYWWSLFAPGEMVPSFQYQGVSATHTFAQSAKDGAWLMTLNVTDSFGIDYDPMRPATAQYRKETFVGIDSEPPSISDVSQHPSEFDVRPQDEVAVNATVVDAISGVKQVILNYTTNNGTWHGVDMANLEANVWTATIPAFPYGTDVTYAVVAEDNAGNTISTSETGYNQYIVVPELPSSVTMFLLGSITLLVAIILRKRQRHLR